MSMDVQETLAALPVVGKVKGHDVIRREAALEAGQRLERELQVWKNALWKACGDDERVVNGYVESQR
jgi:hypothetical protein